LKKNMVFSLKINTSALNDLQDAIDWYEGKQLGLGKRFLTDFENALSRIQKNPYIFKLEDNYRNALLDVFPYLVIYELNSSEIIILGVFNTHQNPTKKP